MHVTIPTKLTSRIQVLTFFGEIFKLPLTEHPNALQETAATTLKALVLVDDTHNLFLSCQDGFGGYNTLLELMSHSPRTLFWCLAFNHHAWCYLNSVYARHQYFGQTLYLTAWSEQAIQELILSTHNKTTFQLSYDDILQAVGGQSNANHELYIENRFFSLLHQQSKGNPRLAIYLWLSSLRLVGEQALCVGLPDEPESSILSGLSEDALFVFASIARHENLTLAQIQTVTQLPEAVVRQVLDMGLRLQLLNFEKNHLYRLAILHHYPLIHYLQAKHCLYE